MSTGSRLRKKKIFFTVCVCERDRVCLSLSRCVCVRAYVKCWLLWTVVAKSIMTIRPMDHLLDRSALCLTCWSGSSTMLVTKRQLLWHHPRHTPAVLFPPRVSSYSELHLLSARVFDAIFCVLMVEFNHVLPENNLLYCPKTSFHKNYLMLIEVCVLGVGGWVEWCLTRSK